MGNIGLSLALPATMAEVPALPKLSALDASVKARDSHADNEKSRPDTREEKPLFSKILKDSYNDQGEDAPKVRREAKSKEDHAGEPDSEAKADENEAPDTVAAMVSGHMPMDILAVLAPVANPVALSVAVDVPVDAAPGVAALPALPPAGDIEQPLQTAPLPVGQSAAGLDKGMEDAFQAVLEGFFEGASQIMAQQPTMNAKVAPVLQQLQAAGNEPQMLAALQALREPLVDLQSSPEITPELQAKVAKLLDAIAQLPQAQSNETSAGPVLQSLLRQKKDEGALLPSRDASVPLAALAVPAKTMENTQKTLPFAEAQHGEKAAAPAMVSAGAENASDNASKNQQQQTGAPPNAAPFAGGHSQVSGSVSDGRFDRLIAAEPRPISEQVAFHMKAASQNGASRISIQLDPVELGKLDIQLSLSRDGRAGMIITVDSRQTLELLQRDVAGLTSALTDAGLKADSGSLSFNLRGEQQSQQQAYRPQAGYAHVEADPLEEALQQLSIKSYVMQVRDGLDIQI